LTGDPGKKSPTLFSLAMQSIANGLNAIIGVGGGVPPAASPGVVLAESAAATVVPKGLGYVPSTATLNNGNGDEQATDSAANGNPNIQFGANDNQSNHTFRHVISGGYDATAVQNAVTSDLNNVRASLPQGQYTGTVVVNGTTFTYSSYKLPDGTINVGRITPPR
jgi:hypothetical protein